MKVLVIVSSKTGNTRLLAHGIADALGADLCDAGRLPGKLDDYDVVLLGFWCDKGEASADIVEAARHVHGKRLGCFATIGGNPNTSKAKMWMRETSQTLATLGCGNRLQATFLCRGRIDPAVFERMTQMLGGAVSPEREAGRRASETHPDRLDVLHAAQTFSSMLANSGLGQHD